MKKSAKELLGLDEVPVPTEEERQEVEGEAPVLFATYFTPIQVATVVMRHGMLWLDTEGENPLGQAGFRDGDSVLIVRTKHRMSV